MDNLDEKIKALQEELLGSKKEIVAATEYANANREAEKAVAKAEAELAQRLAALREEKHRLTRQYQERAKAIKIARDKEEETNRQLQKLINERELQKSLSVQSDKFDSLTAGAPWREWAYSHQISGAKHLAATKRAILGDKRGLGKSLTALIFLDMVQADKTIIFTPKDVSLNFESEVKRWTPNRPVIVLTSATKTMRDTILAGVKVMPKVTIILNYEAWRKDSSLLERLIECQFDTVVVDEAHKIKKDTGLDYKGIYRLVHEPNCCPICSSANLESDLKRGRYCADCLYESNVYDDFCSVKNCVPMTGTSIINRPDDIWPLLKLIDPIRFGSRNQFLRDYCTQDLYTGHWKFRYGGEERLLKSLGMRFIGRTPESAGVTMPPQVEQRHIIEFDPVAYPRQWKLMRQINEFAQIAMSEDVALNVVGRLAQLTRLTQALTCPGGIKMYDVDANGNPDYNSVLFTSDVTESIKIDKAIEIIEEAIAEGDRVVLFSRFKEALKDVQNRLNDLGITNVRYDGDLSDSAARIAQLDFDIKTAASHSSDEKCDEHCPNYGNYCNGYKYQVLLGQYQKAGTGLNLTGARQMVILDRYYAHAYENQASGRIQRLDSRDDTVVHNIIVVSHIKGKATVDEWMNNLIEEKKKMSEDYDQAHLTSDLMKALQDGDIL
jgi:SNF2 family DNA or RNA helicase